MSSPSSPTPRRARSRTFTALCLLGLATSVHLSYRHSASTTGETQAPVPPRLPGSASPAASSPTAQAPTADGQDGLWQAFDIARRTIQPLTPEEAALPGNEEATAFSYHPGQGLAARYAPDGVRFSGPREDWKASFSYQGSAATSTWETSGIRAELDHGDGVTEWFENRSEGIEHGFTVHHPQDEDSGALMIDVELDGLTATASEDPAALALLADDGTPKLKYSGLKVWDATGATLTASMSPSAAGIAIHVDTRGAHYPITIDPLITTLEETLQQPVTGTGSQGDQFGWSVAMDGNVAMIGARNDTTAGGTASGAVYVFELESGLWVQKAILAPDPGSASMAFGAVLALSGNTAVMGVPIDDLPGQTTDSGSVYVFARTGAGWTKQAKIIAPAPVSLQNFGDVLALDGSTLAISNRDPSINRGDNIHIYTRTGTTWSLQQVLRESEVNFDYYDLGRVLALSGDTLAASASGGPNDAVKIFTRSAGVWTERTKVESGLTQFGDTGFGNAIALKGGTLLVGAYDEPQGIVRTGAAYFFKGSGATWALQSKVLPAGAVASDNFGASVALDGDVALIGRPGTRTGGLNFAGSLNVYRRSGDTWTFASQAVPQTPVANLGFGGPIALSGGRALLGLNRTTTDAGTFAGVANIYTVSEGNLVFETQLTAGVETPNKRFGYSVAIDGDTVAVGAADETTASGAESGRAYVFTRGPEGWDEQARLTASDSRANLHFGTAMALSGDTLMVASTGNVYALVRDGGAWSHQEKLYPDSSAGNFGSSIALEGDTAVIGAPGTGNSHGRAFVFTRSGGLWDQQATLEENQRRAFAYFGTSVALEGSTILVGTPQTGLHPGVAHVFTRSGSAWAHQATLECMGDLRFGTSVALSGNLALVGAPGTESLPDPVPADGTGAAHLFARSGNTWNRINRFTPKTATAVHRFGKSVAIDGGIALVGAEERYTDGGPDSDGATYVYAREGITWARQGMIAGLPDGATASAVALSGDTAVVASSTEDFTNPVGLLVPNNGSVRIYRLSGLLSSGPESMLLGTFDTDANGSLTSTEWLALYVAPPKKEKLFALVDSDASGSVSLPEFLAARSQPAAARTIDAWIARATVFQEVDANSDDQVTREEIAIMWPPGTSAKTIDAFWARAQGGSGLDLKEWVRTKVLPNFSTYQTAKPTRAKRAEVAADLDGDDNGLITRTEFAVLFPSGTATKTIDAAWRAACGTPKKETPPAAITIQEFIEAPKLPQLPD